jgi:hypothetical protein
MTEKGLFRLFTNASKLESTLRLRSFRPRSGSTTGQAKKGKGVYETPSSFVSSSPAKLTAGKLRDFVMRSWLFILYAVHSIVWLKADR